MIGTNCLKLCLLLFLVLVIVYYMDIHHDPDHAITDTIIVKDRLEDTDFGAAIEHSQEPPPIANGYLDQLDPDAVPRQVLYYWCGTGRRFQFQNYMSMMSVIRVLQPDNIYFLYDEYPEVDMSSYYTWFEELKEDYPFIRLEQVVGCPVTVEERITVIMGELIKRGGFYVHENTTILASVAGLRDRDMVNALDLSTGQGFLMGQVDAPLDTLSRVIACANASREFSPSGLYCVNTEGEIYPKDIWELNGTFGELARWAAYGESAPMRAQPDYSVLAPNIAHYTWPHWEGRGTMDFAFYLTVLSALYVANIDTVYIHGEAPTGPYWDKLQSNNRIKVIYRNTNTMIFGQRVKKMAHISDIWRLDIILKYGGLYLDMDAVVLKPLDVHMRAYSAYLSLDWIGPGWIKVFPKVVQNGAMLGKRGGKFWQEYQKTQRVFNDSRWIWNSCEMPYKVVERFPKSVHIDPYFQVNCFNGQCHPTWWPGHSKTLKSHLNTDCLPDWRVVHVFHFTGKVPPELKEEDAWRQSTTIFAEMAEFILGKAGLL